jgi:hypothetical protein
MPTHRTGPRARPLAERLWSRVDIRTPDECWPWTGATNDHGYGVLGLAKDDRTGPGKMARAHRVAFFVTYGYWPGVGRHVCDAPACCNPRHVLHGTQADNLADMWARGRGWSPFQKH